MKSAPGSSGSGGTVTPRVRKSSRPQRRFTRLSVMKMLAVMEQSPNTSHDLVQDFLTSGRTGRRNALPDILGENAATATGDLPEALKKLSTSEEPGSSGVTDAQKIGGATPSTSSSGDAGASCSNTDKQSASSDPSKS